MAHGKECYDSAGGLLCMCELIDAPELLREHQHPAFLYACEVCGRPVTFAGQWCPACLRDSLE